MGLYFYNARYYDASLGRFVQADTIVPDAPNTWLRPLTVNFGSREFAEELARENRGDAPRGLAVVSREHADPFIPQDLNRYSYVRNGPVRHTDPSGYWTLGFGFGVTIGLGGGVSFSVVLVVDDKLNFGVALSGGGGAYAGAGGSAVAMVQATDADTIHRLNGPVVQTGASVDLGLSVGGEWLAQKGPTGPINGLNINVGVGFDAKIPCPIEVHGLLEYTTVITPFRDPMQDGRSIWLPSCCSPPYWISLVSF